MKLMALAISLAITASAGAFEQGYIPGITMEGAWYESDYEPPRETVNKWCKLCDDHYTKAIEAEKKAKETSMLLPQGTNRDMANYCFTTFMASFARGTPREKIIGMAIVLLTNYGLQMMDQWQSIIENMHAAKYHYEMKTWYYGLLEYYGYEYVFDNGQWKNNKW